MHGYKWPIKCTRIRTVRTIVRTAVERADGTVALNTGDDDGSIGAAFASGLALSDFAKGGLGGRVDLIKAQAKLGAHYDTTLVVQMPAVRVQ